MADRLVLTKIDLAGREAAASLQERLAALNPGATLFTASLESGPGPNELFDSGFAVVGKPENVQQWLREESFRTDAHHSHPDVNRHDSRVASFCLTIDVPIEWGRLVEWLKLLLASRGDQILRLKGILNLAGRSRPVIIQGVQHVFYPPVEYAAWPDADRSSKIVFITSDLPRAGVEESLRQFLSQRDPKDAP